MNVTVRKNGGIPSLLADFFSPVSLFDREMPDVFMGPVSARPGINLPAVNIIESPKEFRVELAVPGFERKDFTIEMDEQMLNISAEKPMEKHTEEETFTRKEYSFDSFSRSFRMPENTGEEKIDAKYENGILKITIPKLQQVPKPVHRIEVS